MAIGNGIRARRPPSGELPDQLEYLPLRRVLAAKRVPPPEGATFERRAVSRRHVIDVRVRPRVLRADEARQLVLEVIGDQPADEVAFGERARAVDHARIDADDRQAVARGVAGDTIRRHFRPLVVVRLDRRGAAARRERDERRGIEHARNLPGAGDRQHVAEPADVDVVEVGAAGAARC